MLTIDVEMVVVVLFANDRQSPSVPPEEVMAEMKAIGDILVNAAVCWSSIV